jgi:hypothetical protein
MRQTLAGAMVVGMMLAGSGKAPAQTQDPQVAQASVPLSHPLLSFPVTHVDLGPISDEAPVVTPLRFTNTSGRTVRLDISGCHLCGLPTSDKESYAPGESGVVFVTIEPMGRRGPARGTGGIGVKSASGRVTPEGHVTLIVTAEIRPRVWAEPPQMMAPELVRSEGRVLRFEVAGRDPRPGEPFAVTDSSPGIEFARLTLSPPERVVTTDDAYTRYQATLALTPDAPLGDIGIPVRFATNRTDVPILEYPIATRVLGEVIAAPDPVFIGTLTPAEPFSAEFRVLGRAGEPVMIESIDVADRGLAEAAVVDAQAGPGGLWWTVRVSGRSAPREIMFDEVRVTVVARAGAGEAEAVVVPVRMTVRFPPPTPSPSP